MTLKSMYQKQRRRIQRLISSYRSKGIDVEYFLPKIPKKITQKSINRLSKVTSKTIQSKSYVPDFETGERRKLTTYLKSGKTLKSIRTAYNTIRNQTPIEPVAPPTPEPVAHQVATPTTPKPTAPSFEDIVITNFKGLISLFPEEAQQIMRNWLAETSKKMSRSELADFLEETNNRGLWPSVQESYNMQNIYDKIGEMTELMELSGGEKNQILTALDADDIWDGELYT